MSEKIPQRSSAPDLSIIIVNWNAADLLRQCLQSLRESDDHLEKEIIVIDNASTDGSVEMVRREFPEVRLICNPENMGFAPANNQGIEISQGQYVLLLNSDARILPGALDALVGFLAAHPAVGAVGPALVNPDGSFQVSCHPILTPWREFWRLLFLDHLVPLARYPFRRWGYEDPREVDVIKGACLLLRRQALKQVGLLDEGYFMYSEEMDLCYRLARAGWRIYWVPEARVVHLGGGSSCLMAEEMYVELYRSKIHFQRKFGGARRAWLMKGLLGFAYVPRLLLSLVGGLFSARMKIRARVYARLLCMLPMA